MQLVTLNSLQDVSYTARSLSELVYALEERFSGLVKMAIN